MKLAKKLVFQICLLIALVALSATGVYLIVGDKNPGINLPGSSTSSEEKPTEDMGKDIITDGIEVKEEEVVEEIPAEDQETSANASFVFGVYLKVWSGGSLYNANLAGYMDLYWRNSKAEAQEWKAAPSVSASDGKTASGTSSSSTSTHNVYSFYLNSGKSTAFYPARYVYVGWYTMSTHYSSSYFGWGTTAPSSDNWKTSYTSSKSSNFYIYGSSTTSTSESTARDACSTSMSGSTYAVLRRAYTFKQYNTSSSTTTNKTVYDGIGVNVGTNSYTKTGWTANGWTTSSTMNTANGTRYSNGSTWYPTANLTLYPAFTINTYVVWSYFYYAQGVTHTPTSRSITASSLTMQYDNDSGSRINRDWNHTYTTTSYTITCSASHSSGYTYYLCPTANATTAQNDNYVGSRGISWAPTSDTYATTNGKTMYAYERYSITYNGNGYTGGTVPSTQYKAHGASRTLSTSTPTRTGYLFQGWGTSSTTSTVSYAAGASYSENVSRTLYAVWKPITYTVVYNRNEGAYSNRSTTFDTVGGSTASSGHTYNVSKALTSNGFTMTNWSFAGWNTNSAGTGTNYSNGQSVSNLTTTNGGTVNLYAKWTPITISVKVNIVTYDTSGASSSTVGGTATIAYDNSSSTATSASQTTASVTYTAHKQQNFRVTASAKSGYTLVAITSNSTCPTTATNTSGYTWNPTSGTTYYVYFRQRSAYRMQNKSETVDSSSKTKYYISSTTLGWAPQTKVATPSGLSTDGTFTVPGASTFTVYKDGSGNKYVYAGGAYFKFEPIVWLVSTAPSYGATATNISVVSEKILFAARFNSSTSLSEGWSYKSSELYTWSTSIQTALNLGTNLKSKTWAGTKYAAAGTEGKVAADNYTASAAQIASMSEIEANYATSFSGNRNAYCTDFAYYLMTGNTTMPSNVSDRYIDCWTRDLANQRGTASYYRIAPDTANTTAALIKDTGFVNQVKGIRLSAYMTTATYY